MTRRAMRSLFSSPIRVQCSPPSIDLYTPSPIDALLRGLPSPVPAKTTFGFEGATAIAPIDATACPSKTGLRVVPPLVVLTTPPLAPATKYVEGSPAIPATTDTRPALLVG